MNGKACMQVFPNSTLYDDKKVLEAMLNGDVQLAAPSLSKFEKFTKKFRIFDLPFVFEDVAAVDRFQNSADGEKLLNSMKRRGLKGVAFWHNGMKQMSANRPLIVASSASGSSSVSRHERASYSGARGVCTVIDVGIRGTAWSSGPGGRRLVENYSSTPEHGQTAAPRRAVMKPFQRRSRRRLTRC